MNNLFTRLFVFGFPCLYGGAGTELHHQIIAWRSMGMEVHLIPTYEVTHEALLPVMTELGVHIHRPFDFDCLQPGDPILGFCNSEFLESLPEIRKRTKRTVFVNCMTWLFDKEKEAMAKGDIAMFLYQNEEVRLKNMPILRTFNDDPQISFNTFNPYFYHEDFPFIRERSDEHFGCGRISRQDADKFARNTLCIYEYFVSRKPKQALFLGFDERSAKKIGSPFPWIRTASDQTVVSQQEFYRHCEIVLQPTDTTENWPRIGLESMSSGSVLIVDNRGGWRQMVEHGKTGWLCDNEREFIYYASRMGFEPNLRADMAEAARERLEKLSGLSASTASWQEVFAAMNQLPE